MSEWKLDENAIGPDWQEIVDDKGRIIATAIWHAFATTIVREHNAMPKMREALKAVYHDDPSERISLETRAKVLAALEASNA